MKKRLLTITGVSILALAVAMVFGVIAPEQAYAKYSSGPKTTIKLSVEKPHYSVRFHANTGGDEVQGTMADQEFTFGTAQALTPNAFERSGYTFAGWNTEENGSGDDYADGVEVINLAKAPNEVFNLYAQWEAEGMQTKFEINGTCVFHGYDVGQITGDDCIVNGYDWANSGHTYIDTGIKLYDSNNYNKDYEIGFTIVEYDPSAQRVEPIDGSRQATFVNSKFEDASRHYPGIVVRKNENQIEATQTITWPDGVPKRVASTKANTHEGTKVVITRVDGVVYYSFNGGAFQLLQDMNGTEDYIDTTVWFGASAQADGTPWRYVDATLTNLYVKVGNTGANKHIVSFNAGGVVSDPNDVTIISSSKIGSKLPSMPGSVEVDNDTVFFNGWYTKPNGKGERVNSDYVVSGDMQLYAYWRESDKLCSVSGNGTEYSSLQGCISAAGASDTITLLSDIVVQDMAVGSDKVITLDLNGFTISDNRVAGKPIIENGGTLTIINGTITMSINNGAINNISTGKLYIGNGARIITTSERQAIYNDGGELVISDGAYLANTSSNAKRATVHSRNNGTTAKVTITGGTIISDSAEAVKIESGTLTIGTSGSPISREVPIIQGATYGVNTSVDITMYDGELRGKTAAINNAKRITLTEVGASLIGINLEETAMIDGVVYKILYCQ